MRVAIITRDYPPSAGGVSTHASNLAKELGRAGVEVEVFVGHTDVNNLLLPTRARLGGYDLVHVQSAPYGALVRGIPMVVTVHSPIPTEFFGYGLVSKLKSMPSLPLEAVSLTKARRILAVSEATRDDIVRIYRVPREKVVVIGNGVGKEFFLASGGRRDPKRILVVSRLEKRKNVKEAVSAICALQPQTYEAEIVGTGSQMQSLKAFARTKGANVSFLGRVKNDVLPSHYSSASIFLSTSLSEGFGLSLLEAMASGCAVLASNIAAHRSLIVHGVNGMLYSTFAELRSTLGELLSSPETCEELGRKARETAKGHTWQAVARKTLAAYQKAA